MLFVLETVVRKAAIRHGDPTTTRGIVFAYSSTIYDDRKHVALSGDEATCGNCEGIFKIFGTGKGMSEKGRDVVVEGDLVLCPCKANRVLAGRNPGIFLETRSDGVPAVAHATASSAELMSDTSEDDIEQFFEIVDAITRKPVEGLRCKVLSNGYTLVDDVPLVHGRTRSFSMKMHPNISVVAWRTGGAR
ncbi:PAAR domain-containing protein [Burkholderia pyrrocinia]|uniref:PAAR domain-containing protein n=1 Tax=Burkholderia pyrrocinia TaxID=60550 RepID=UPI001F2AEAA9|nr:PAAR domain-containing protein [Burkholderia pyrrocinia]